MRNLVNKKQSGVRETTTTTTTKACSGVRRFAEVWDHHIRFSVGGLRLGVK